MGATGISDNGFRFIAEFEGGKSADGLYRAYWDPFGKVWTIGVGETENVHRGMVWTEAQADRDFQVRFAREYAPSINALGADLNQNQFDALASFVWNLGAGSMQWDVGRDVAAGRFQEAADAILQYDHAGGVKLAGLTRRREAERALFLKPFVAPDPHGYGKLDKTVRHLHGRKISEYQTITEYDRERRWWRKYSKRLRRLKQNCGYLAERLEVERDIHGHWTADQEWRHGQLILRKKGKRVVG